MAPPNGKLPAETQTMSEERGAGRLPPSEGHTDVTVNSGANLHPGPTADVLKAQTNFELVAKPQDADPRESQIEYIVQVTNPSKDRIRITSLRAFAPRGAKVDDAIDITQTSQRSRLTKVYKELSLLLTEFLVQTSKEYQDALVYTISNILNGASSHSALGQRLLFRLFTGSLARSIKDWLGTEEALRIQINSAAYGQVCYDRFLKNSEQKDGYLANVFRSKLEEARELEPQIKVDNTWLATLEPGATYSRTFIFHCERRKLNPKPYTFLFDCAYQFEGVDQSERHCQGSVTADINPSPLFLNLIALSSALLGALLKMAVVWSGDTSNSKPLSLSQFLDAVSAQFSSLETLGTYLAAAISAVLFFNVYDSTAIGSKLKFGSGWRSALLIGGLSGLMTQKVVGALQALLS